MPLTSGPFAGPVRLLTDYKSDTTDVGHPLVLTTTDIYPRQL